MLFSSQLSSVSKVRYHQVFCSTMKQQRWACRSSPITGICSHRSQTTGVSCSQLSRCQLYFSGSGICASFCDRHMWQVSVTGSCTFRPLWIDQCSIPRFQNVSWTYCQINYAQWSIRGKPLEVIFIITSLTVFSRWHRLNCCHIVWHGSGRCDARWHTGNLESLQAISMERFWALTSTGGTKYVIFTVAK